MGRRTKESNTVQIIDSIDRAPGIYIAEGVIPIFLLLASQSARVNRLPDSRRFLNRAPWDPKMTKGRVIVTVQIYCTK
jgi:hypothetical protein